MNARNIEIAHRASNGQMQIINNYALTNQKLVRIGSAPPPKSDLQIHAGAQDIEPLHLLLRAMNRKVDDYELLNVSSQPITLYHPTHTTQTSAQQIGANDGPVPLSDYDYLEFGNQKFLLTYQTCEWLDMQITITSKNLRSGQLAREMPLLSLKLKAGEQINATLTVSRCGESQNIASSDILDLTSEIRGLDAQYCDWTRIDGTTNFSGESGAQVRYQLTCKADCPAPGITQRVHFVVTLRKQGHKLHSVARGVDLQLVPCGPFALQFTSPNRVRR